MNAFDPTKTKQLITIQKEELRKYWHLVEPGLNQAITELPFPDGWIAPDVYIALMEGRASLLMCSIARHQGYAYASREQAILDSCGFTVVVVQPNQDGKKSLFIWFAASNDATNKGDTPSVMISFNEDMNEIAKACGCDQITFTSNRVFWEKVAPRFGFEVQEVKWSRPIR